MIPRGSQAAAMNERHASPSTLTSWQPHNVPPFARWLIYAVLLLVLVSGTG